MHQRKGASPTSGLLACLITLCLVSSAAWAKGPKVTKVSASRIKKDVSSKDVVKVEVSKGGGPTWYPSEGRTLWEQGVHVHYRTPYKGVTHVQQGDVVYVWTGGGWKYDKLRPGGSWYEGFANPTPQEFAAALAVAGEESVLDSYLLTVATKIYSVAIAADPKWNWSEPTRVSFHVAVVYDKKVSNSDLAKVEQSVKISMNRESVTGKFADFCQTHPDCISGGGRGGQATELSRTTVGSKRLSEMKSLDTVAREHYMKPRYAALNPPEKWTDLTQFARYAYKALYSGDEQTWEAFLYYNDNPWEVFQTGKQVFLANKDAFRAQFCPELVITKKTGRKNKDEAFLFSDKGGKSQCGINVQDFNGFRVDKVWCEFAVGDEAAALAAIPEARGCVEKLAPDNPLGLKRGDEVLVSWKNQSGEGWNHAEVDELLNEVVAVRYSNGANDRVAYDRVRRPDAVPARATKPTAAQPGVEKPTPPATPAKPAGPHPSGLKLGDKVMSKWHGNGREYPGKVSKLEAKRVFVHYDDGTNEWVPIEAVRKR